jgi:threonine aldolase
MKGFRSFASDNNAPVHDRVFKAMLEANEGDAIAYGDDPCTEEALQLFKELFGPESKTFFVFNGTGANVAAISHLTKPYHAIVSSDKAHIHHDECGAPEKFSGCKLHILPSNDGKIKSGQIKPFLHSLGFQHHSQLKVISITQATEMGAVYSLEEIKSLSDFAKQHNMFLHMDGARIANAAAYLNVSLKEMVTLAGVDVLSFGGTKNGMMMGEAVVFLNPLLVKEFEYTRKQSMQLASKMRYISAQFKALLSDGLWLENARHANNMAKLLEERLREIPDIQLTQPVQINAIFAILPPKAIDKLLKEFFFYTWDASRHEVRWMTSYNTTEEDVMSFIAALKVSLR